jgi:hypothetical protein
MGTRASPGGAGTITKRDLLLQKEKLRAVPPSEVKQGKTDILSSALMTRRAVMTSPDSDPSDPYYSTPDSGW